MALCSICSDSLSLPEPSIDLSAGALPHEADACCPACGQRRYTTCGNCGGTGYTYIESLRPDYCTACGRRICKTTRCRCFLCNGSGRVVHICTRVGVI